MALMDQIEAAIRPLTGLKGVGFLVVYLYGAGLSLLGLFQFLVFGRSSAWRVYSRMVRVMGIKIRKKKKSPALAEQSQRPLVFLGNHRSWADFFVDPYIVGGATFLSRWMVALGVPVNTLFLWCTHNVLFFKRQRGLDKEQLSNQIQENLRQSSSGRMLVYPEGTRSTKAEPLPLKWGVVKMLYDRKTPVQVIVTTNKEKVCNEKAIRIEQDVVCEWAASEVIDPENFDDWDKFQAHIEKEFKSTWELAYDESAESEEYAFKKEPSARSCEQTRGNAFRAVGIASVWGAVTRLRGS